MLAWLKWHSFDTESQIRLVVSALVYTMNTKDGAGLPSIVIANLNPRGRSSQHLMIIISTDVAVEIANLKNVWRGQKKNKKSKNQWVINASHPFLYLTPREHPQLKASSSSPSSAETLWWRYGGAQGYSNRADAHYYAAQDLTL